MFLWLANGRNFNHWFGSPENVGDRVDYVTEAESLSWLVVGVTEVLVKTEAFDELFHRTNTTNK